jgi:hypothetical protein
VANNNNYNSLFHDQNGKLNPQFASYLSEARAYQDDPEYTNRNEHMFLMSQDLMQNVKSIQNKVNVNQSVNCYYNMPTMNTPNSTNINPMNSHLMGSDQKLTANNLTSLINNVSDGKSKFFLL